MLENESNTEMSLTSTNQSFIKFDFYASPFFLVLYLIVLIINNHIYNKTSNKSNKNYIVTWNRLPKKTHVYILRVWNLYYLNFFLLTFIFGLLTYFVIIQI